jgi:hypothetical protein
MDNKDREKLLIRLLETKEGEQVARSYLKQKDLESRALPGGFRLYVNRCGNGYPRWVARRKNPAGRGVNSIYFGEKPPDEEARRRVREWLKQHS